MRSARRVRPGALGGIADSCLPTFELTEDDLVFLDEDRTDVTDVTVTGKRGDDARVKLAHVCSRTSGEKHSTTKLRVETCTVARLRSRRFA
jgi:hypothetical protein